MLLVSHQPVLWCALTRCACQPARIGGSVDGAAEHTIHKQRVVGHDRCRQMVAHAFARLQHFVDLRVVVLGHHLKRTKDLCGHGVKVLLQQQLLQRHKDRSRFNGTCNSEPLAQAAPAFANHRSTWECCDWPAPCRQTASARPESEAAFACAPACAPWFVSEQDPQSNWQEIA